MFERFNPASRRVIRYAHDWAFEHGCTQIDPQCILIALIDLSPKLFDRSLEPTVLFELRQALSAEGTHDFFRGTKRQRKLSAESWRVLRNARKEANNEPCRPPASSGMEGRRPVPGIILGLLRLVGFRQTRIEPRHLLLGLLEESETPAAVLLRERGFTMQAAANEKSADSEL